MAAGLEMLCFSCLTAVRGFESCCRSFNCKVVANALYLWPYGPSAAPWHLCSTIARSILQEWSFGGTEIIREAEK